MHTCTRAHTHTQIHCPRLTCQDPPPAKVTRKDQLDAKGEEPGRGRGRGRGRGKGVAKANAKSSSSKGPKNPGKTEEGDGENLEVDEWESKEWQWEDEYVWTDEYGYVWVGTEETVPEKEPKKKKPRRTTSTDPTAASATTEPKKKRSRSKADHEKSAPAPREKKQRKANNPKASPEHGLLPPAPDTEKEIKKEIYDFLLETRTLTQLNAKEHLRKLVPEYKVLGYTAKLNIYWVRRKVQGVGVGITSITEGQDVGFIGFKPLSPNWITAIAAAIKAGDIFAAFLHTDCGVAVLTLYPLRARSWFPGLKDGLKKNKHKCMHGHYIVTKYK